jgi:hypothetical protein
VTGYALVNYGLENIGFVILVVTMAFDVSAFKGICSTDAECVSVLGVKALSSMPKRVTFGVNVTVAAGSPKSLVGVDILAVGPTNGVVSVRV